MKTRHVALLAGMFLVTVGASAYAHEPGRVELYPANLNGAVTLWGGSHGPSGWAGTLTIGSPIVLGTRYVPVAVLPPSHRHSARSHHVPRHVRHHGYRTAWRDGYAHGHKKGYKQDRGRGRGHRYDD